MYGGARLFLWENGFYLSNLSSNYFMGTRAVFFALGLPAEKIKTDGRNNIG